MAKRLFYWELGGFFAASLLGTILHFAHDLVPWLAPVAAVNESTWEHMKLLYVGMLAVTVVQLGFLGRTYPNLPAVRAVSQAAAAVLIPVLHYTYIGILGRYIPWVSIMVFYIAAAVGFALDWLLLRRGALSDGWMQAAGLAVLLGIMFLFVWWTFRPPEIPLFRDPVTGGYGPLLR